MLLRMKSARRLAARLCHSAAPAVPARQGARLDADTRDRADRLQRIDAADGELPAAIFDDQAGRSIARAQDRFFGLRRAPHGRGLIAARKHARDRTAGCERLEMPAQFVVRQDAREIHERILAGEIPVPQPAQRVIGRVPRGGRIDDQQCAALLAVARGNQQCARPDVVLPRQRRNAQQIEVIGAIEREKAGAIDLRADEIVIADWRSIIPIRIGTHIGRGKADGIERAIRPLRRNFADEMRQFRAGEDARNMPLIGGLDRQVREYFLIFHVACALDAHTLHREIEAHGSAAGILS